MIRKGRLKNRGARMKEHQVKKKRKKKSRFGYYLYAFVTFILAIAIILVSLFVLTFVQELEIQGTEYMSEQEIREEITKDPYTMNSVYTMWKYKQGGFTFPTIVENVTIKLKAPWEVIVTVNEKDIVGCVLINGSYVYFSEDQTVITKSSTMIEGIPVVEGLEVSEVKVREPLMIENEKVFKYIVNVSNEIRENNLQPDRIVWEDDSMNLQFEGICVKLGKSNFDVKLVQVPPILEKLEGQTGTLHLEHYSDVSTNISFEKEEKNY